MIYAGIGSRETPPEVLLTFEHLGEWLATKGDILRSGAADGADAAFERGCDAVGGQKEIFLPWKGFQKSESPHFTQGEAAREVARKFHPAYDRLSDAAKKLMFRNTYQILGEELEQGSPVLSDFVICYTEGGTGKGGTGQALRIAKAYDVPVLDAGSFVKDGIYDKQAFVEAFNQLYQKKKAEKEQEGEER